MPKQQSIRKTKGKITVTVDAIVFKEDNQTVYYSPALELSSYGSTKADAEAAFMENLIIFIDYADKKGTLTEELLDLGWS